MEDSYVAVGSSGTGYYGTDATRLFGAIVVCRSIKFYLKTGMKTNRAYTPKNMIHAAHLYTGKPPLAKGTVRAKLERAASDLDVWIENMKLAMPVVERD